jgi:hypothetical protein
MATFDRESLNLNPAQMKKILFSCSIIFLCIAAQAQNPVNLRLNLEKNKVYRLGSVAEQTIAQTINGVQQTTESHTSYTVSLKMLDATPDFMITEVRYDTMATRTNTMGKVVNMSSANEGNIKSSEMADVVSCIMNRLSKNAIYAKLDFSGKPIEILNSRMLSEIILKDTADISLTGPTADAVKKQVLAMISDGELKTMIEMFTWYLPGREVSSGDSWTLSQQVNSGGMKLDISTTFKLTGLEGDNALITSESSIKAAENAVPLQSGGATVTYSDLKGLSKTTMKIDVRTGLLVDQSGKTHLAGNLGISAPGFSMQMPMDINGETKVYRIQ